MVGLRHRKTTEEMQTEAQGRGGGAQCLRGKVALVTGGAQGIGRAVVQSLLQSSAKVTVVDLNKSRGDECKAQLDAEFGAGSSLFVQCDVSNAEQLRDGNRTNLRSFDVMLMVVTVCEEGGGGTSSTTSAATCDELCVFTRGQLDAEPPSTHSLLLPPVSHPDAFQTTVDQFGRLDIVINNAGINNEKNWEKTVQVNLTSVIQGTYLALEHMSKEYGKAGGTIINVSSMAAFLHSPHQPVYTATKHGVIGFTRAIADASSLGDYGVRINVLCPAFVDTPLLSSVEHEDNMGKFVKFKDDFKLSMKKFGVLTPALVAEGMMRLIMDPSLNGAVMKITCSKGIHFHTYEPMSA